MESMSNRQDTRQRSRLPSWSEVEEVRVVEQPLMDGAEGGCWSRERRPR